MNKTELVQKLARQTDLTQAKAAEVIDSIFSIDSGQGIIAVELDAGREVTISGFGKFETRRRSARHRCSRRLSRESWGPRSRRRARSGYRRYNACRPGRRARPRMASC